MTGLLAGCCWSTGALAGVDVLHGDHEVAVDPPTATVLGTSRYSIGAEAGGGAVEAATLLLDAGLSVTAASVDGAAVDVVQAPSGAWNVVTVALPLPLSDALTATVELSYAGVLVCEEYSPLLTACDLGSPLMRLDNGSVPPAMISGSTLDRATQQLVVHAPSGYHTTAALTELLDQTDDGVTQTSVWVTPEPLSSFTFFAISSLPPEPITEAPIETTFWDGQPPSDWADKYREWVPRIVDFLEDRLDRPLPFSRVALLRRSPTDKEVGYTAPAYIALADLHADKGDLLFEEALAHEFTHFWWGVMVVTGDPEVQTVSREGVPVLFQIDYSAVRAGVEGREREEFLGSRYHEANLAMRYLPGKHALAPVAVQSPDERPTTTDGGETTFAWEYLKTAAVLDYLRLYMGDEAFDAALQLHIDACSTTVCTIEDLRAALTITSPEPLDAFFAQWVFGSEYVELGVGFRQDEPDSVLVELEQERALSVPLELWIEYFDGSYEPVRVQIEATSSSFELPAAGPVLAVRINPRQQTFVRSRSPLEGDVDFDGEVDGFDVLHCARREGKSLSFSVLSEEGGGYLGADLEFDPACDPSGDGRQDPEELDPILAAFGDSRRAP